MLALERHLEIVNALKVDGSMRVSELALRFGVTEETIRRDLDRLEKEGLVVRTHGGAMAAEQAGSDAPYWHRERVHADEKLAIAKEAVSRVREGDRILLDASSSAWYLAQHLPDMPLTVVTNALQVAMALSERMQIKVICVGGTLSRTSLSFQGAVAQKALLQFQVDKLFLSGTALDIESGLRDDNEQHATLKQDMIGISGRKYLIVDSSKIGKTALTRIAGLEAFDELITDDRIDDSVIPLMEDKGIVVTSVATSG